MNKEIPCLRHSLNNVIYSGMAIDAMFAFASGPILIAYAMMFGAGPIIIGIFGSIEFIGNVAYLLSSYLLQKGFTVKEIAVKFSAYSRPFYLIAALLAFAPKNAFSLALLTISIFLAYILSAINGGVFYPWMKVLVPKRIMGRFFAERCRWMMIANMICYAIGAGVIYIFERYLPNYTIYAYSILLSMAFLLGAYSVYSLAQVKNVEIECVNTQSFFPKMIQSFKLKNFSMVCFFLSLLNFATSFVTPFFTVFMLKKMGITMPFVILLTFLSQLSYIISTKFWAKYIDRKGCLLILKSGCFLYVLSLCCFICCIYIPVLAGIFLLFLAHIILGLGRFAIKLGTNNMPILYVPTKDSSIFLSIISVSRACGSAFSGIASGALLLGLEALYECGNMTWLLFWIIGMILFLMTILMVTKIHKRNIC